MTPSQLETLFHTLVDDDNLSTDSFYIFANNAFNAVWMRRPWEFAKKSTDANSTAVGVKNYTLPTDFLSPLPIYIGDTEITPCKREDRRLYKDSQFRYYVDTPNNRITLTYLPTTSETIYWDYIYENDDLFSVGNENTDLATLIPGFRKAFHPIIAYEAAKMFYYQEVGSKSDSWTGEMQAEYERLYALMEDFDSQLKASYQNSAIPDIQLIDTKRPTVIDIDEV